MPRATVKHVREFFGMDLKSMRSEWTGDSMPQDQKDEILEGLGAFYELPEATRAAVLDTPTLSPEHKDAGVLTY